MKTYYVVWLPMANDRGGRVASARGGWKIRTGIRLDPIKIFMNLLFFIGNLGVIPEMRF